MWEEKIDMLKKGFSPQEFHVPFTDWFDILKKIESKFIAKEGSMYHLTNWADKIKSKHFVHAIAPKHYRTFSMNWMKTKPIGSWLYWEMLQ
jgi:hypothetical protein